jgi:hypothetical protein
MRSRDIKVGEKYAHYEARGRMFTLAQGADGKMIPFSTLRTVRNTACVEVLDTAAVYQRKLGRYTKEVRPAKGILVRVIEPALVMGGTVAGDEIILTGGGTLVMTWKEFQERAQGVIAYLADQDKKERKATKECEALVASAKRLKIPVKWDRDTQDPGFTISGKTLTKLVKRVQMLEKM